MGEFATRKIEVLVDRLTELDTTPTNRKPEDVKAEKDRLYREIGRLVEEETFARDMARDMAELTAS